MPHTILSQHLTTSAPALHFMRWQICEGLTRVVWLWPFPEGWHCSEGQGTQPESSLCYSVKL